MTKTIEYQNIRENPKYKDVLFRMVFHRKEDLLDLYNAVNGTDYQNPEDLEVNTLESVLYMGMKNDISFLIGCTMNLYEHQSSGNENMPLRGFLYLAKLFEAYITENGVDIYTNKLQKMPTPCYIVFYNGKKDEPDERVLKLSDAFTKEGGCLECEARLLNINYGRNRQLMEKCRRLEEYAIFVAKVREYIMDEEIGLKRAITLAIEDCLAKGVLKDILTKQRSEVLGMVLSTFNKELYEKNLKEDAYNEGRNDGIAEGRAEGRIEGIREKLLEKIRIKLAKGKAVEEIAEDLEERIDTIRELMENM